ncbi:ABC transporter substrate-binding protein [Aquihabitans sp. McL0605]|uniref:ABC transporter substrate-binding protein n=1 Tax=Aquihabitans sp. McL0605 TaxID=3415671 RepID=UPI003CF25196
MPIVGARGDAPRPARTVLIAVATALLLVVASSCASESDAGAGGGGGKASTTTAPSSSAVDDLLGPVDKAKGEPIKIGFVGDGQTAAFDNTSEFTAAQAAVDYWNEHKAGIAGRPVKLVTCPTGGDPAGATDCANKLIEDNVVGVALSQSSVTESVWEPIHQAGVPMMLLAANGTALLEDDQSTYNLNDGNGTLFTLPFSIAKEKKVKKIAFVVIDVPQAISTFEDVGPDLIKKAGLEYELVKVPVGTADMTPQMQQIAAGGAGLVHVIGNDAFCIAAFQGLEAVAYDGEVTSITSCITDATRKSAPASILDGMYVTALTAVGAADDPSYQLYDAIMRQYTDSKAINDPITMSAYTTVSSFLTSLTDLKGKTIDKDTVNTAIKTMDEQEMPGTAGMKFRCGAGESKRYASVCSTQTLQAQLDSEGNPKSYTVGESVGN